MSEDSPGRRPEPPHRLVEALERILRPLVRLLVGAGITYPFLCSLLKRLYVEVASRDFALDGKRATDSRVSLLSGVHRKDVRTLRDDARPAAKLPASVSLGSRVVARWLGEARYLDAAGRPRALPQRAARGPSFEELVATESRQDLRPRAVLDELMRLGIAGLTEDGRVALRVEAFVPSEGGEEKTYYFGRNVADHVAAAVHNLEGGEPPFLERAVSYHGLRAEDVERLREEAGRLGMEMLKTLNRRALDMQRRNRRNGVDGGLRRMSTGLYFFDEPDADAEEQS